jgi:hypothetical protein
MSLDDLSAEMKRQYEDVGETVAVDLDRETRNELAMLAAGLDSEPEALVERGIHLLFQTAVETGRLDFHLRSTYDVTYDEFLSGMTFEEMGGGYQPAEEQDRRYQF